MKNEMSKDMRCLRLSKYRENFYTSELVYDEDAHLRLGDERRRLHSQTFDKKDKLWLLTNAHG